MGRLLCVFFFLVLLMLVVFNSFQLRFEINLFSSWIVRFAAEIILACFANGELFLWGLGFFSWILFHSVSFREKEPGEIRWTELNHSVKGS